MKRTTILMAAFLCLFSLTESPAQNTHKNMELLNLTQEWDKTFPKSDKVIICQEMRFCIPRKSKVCVKGCKS